MASLLQIDLGPDKKRIVVGIDLGTTNSLVACIDELGDPVIIDENGDGIVPSVVAVLDDDRVVVGREAKQHLLTDTEKTVYSVKRLMGKSYTDVEADQHLLTYRLAPKREGLVRVEIAGNEYTPIELSAMILRDLKARAETHFGATVQAAVITVPAYFNDAQRQATKDAGKLAGLDVLRILNEPTAAALAYGLDQGHTGTVAVYDFGGGTFDVSILRLSDGVYQVLSTNGDTYLGGDDIDQALMTMFRKEITEQSSVSEFAPAELQQLRDAAEHVKQKLSSVEEAEIKIQLREHNVEYARTLTRLELDAVAGPIVERTIAPCHKALKDAGMVITDIEAVVLVGGSTRMPLVRRRVEETFGQSPFDQINPDEVVALGAAVQADVLSGNRRDTLLLDVVPLSLGIETVGGMMSTLIARNTTIPTQVSETYTTFADNQTGININVYQGEREFVRDNRHLASFTLGPITPLPAGMHKIDVTFTIDADGILHVSAKDLRDGAEQGMQVKPSYGLTEDEIERMLRESIEKAQEDITERMIVHARTDALAIIDAVNKALTNHLELVGPTVQSELESIVLRLQSAMTGTDHKLVRAITEELEQKSEPLAQLILNRAVSNTLKGRDVGEIENI